MQTTNVAESSKNTRTAVKGVPEQIEVVEVTNGSQLKQFVQLPRSLYTDLSSPYVMPLEMHMKMMMGNTLKAK